MNIGAASKNSNLTSSVLSFVVGACFAVLILYTGDTDARIILGLASVLCLGGGVAFYMGKKQTNSIALFLTPFLIISCTVPVSILGFLLRNSDLDLVVFSIATPLCILFLFALAFQVLRNRPGDKVSGSFFIGAWALIIFPAMFFIPVAFGISYLNPFMLLSAIPFGIASFGIIKEKNWGRILFWIWMPFSMIFWMGVVLAWEVSIDWKVFAAGIIVGVGHVAIAFFISRPTLLRRLRNKQNLTFLSRATLPMIVTFSALFFQWALESSNSPPRYQRSPVERAQRVISA